MCLGCYRLNLESPPRVISLFLRSPPGSIYSNCFIGWPLIAPQARILEWGEVVCIIVTSWFLYGDSSGASIRKNTRRAHFIERSNGSYFVTFRMCFSLFMFYLALLLARAILYAWCSDDFFRLDFLTWYKCFFVSSDFLRIRTIDLLSIGFSAKMYRRLVGGSDFLQIRFVDLLSIGFSAKMLFCKCTDDLLSTLFFCADELL